MQHIIDLIPTVRVLLIWSPISALILWGAARCAGTFWSRGVRTPYTRKIFHFIIFSSAAAIHFTAGIQATSVFGGVVALGVLFAVARGDGFPFYEALARPSDAPRRTFHVIVPLLATAVGGLAANFLAGPLAPVGYLVGGWGDAVGEPVGTNWGRHRYQVPSVKGVKSTRSFEGSAAVFFASLIAAAIGLALLDQEQIFMRALAVAIPVVIVEAVSPHGLDNFFVQVTAAGVAAWSL